MKVQVIRAADDYVLNVQWIDEVAEQQNMDDAEFAHMEAELKKVGRYWVNADAFLKPLR